MELPFVMAHSHVVTARCLTGAMLCRCTACWSCPPVITVAIIVPAAIVIAVAERVADDVGNNAALLQLAAISIVVVSIVVVPVVVVPVVVAAIVVASVAAPACRLLHQSVVEWQLLVASCLGSYWPQDTYKTVRRLKHKRSLRKEYTPAGSQQGHRLTSCIYAFKDGNCTQICDSHAPT